MMTELFETKWEIFLIALVLTILIVAFTDENNKDFRLSELDEGVGYQICTSSVNSRDLLCDDPELIISTYNSSIESLNNFIKDCSSSIIIIDSKECIGQKLTYVNGKFLEIGEP